MSRKIKIKCPVCINDTFISIFKAYHYEGEDGILNMKSDGIRLEGYKLKCVECGKEIDPYKE